MYKGIITSSTVMTANTTIPFITELNTNRNLSIASNGSIQVNTPGYYDINSTIVVTNVAEGAITLNLLANGVVIPEATVSAMSTATSDIITLSLSDIEKVISSNNTNVIFTFETSVACTISSGNTTIVKVS